MKPITEYPGKDPILGGGPEVSPKEDYAIPSRRKKEVVRSSGKLERPNPTVPRTTLSLESAWQCKLVNLISKGEAKEVDSLLDQIDIDEVITDNGMAAIHVAIAFDQIEIFKSIIARGARILPDKRGRWPSTIALMCEVSEELFAIVNHKEHTSLR